MVAPAEFTRMSQRLNFSFTSAKQLLAAFELAQIAGDRQRRWPACAIVLAAAARLCLRRRRDHRLRALARERQPRSRGRCRGFRR